MRRAIHRSPKNSSPHSTRNSHIKSPRLAAAFTRRFRQHPTQPLYQPSPAISSATPLGHHNPTLRINRPPAHKLPLDRNQRRPSFLSRSNYFHQRSRHVRIGRKILPSSIPLPRTAFYHHEHRTNRPCLVHPLALRRFPPPLRPQAISNRPRSIRRHPDLRNPLNRIPRNLVEPTNVFEP